jgi:hypothetical protein
MTNESPGYIPQWIAGEHLPADAQAILRADHDARQVFAGAIDVDRFMTEMIHVQREFNSLARLDLSESAQGVRSDG